MPKRKGCHIEHFIGIDSGGDPCVYFQWIWTETGKSVRFLTEKELSRLLQHLMPQ